MISLSSKRFVMGAFLVMACGYVAASPGIILAEPTSPGPLGPGGNFSVVDGDAGEVEVMPVEDSKAVSVQPRSGGPSCCNFIGVSGGYEHQSTRMGVFTRTLGLQERTRGPVPLPSLWLQVDDWARLHLSIFRGEGPILFKRPLPRRCRLRLHRV